MGIASLVLGIVAIVFAWVPVFPIAAGLVGVILGALAVKKPYKTGLDTAGLVLSIVGIALAFILNMACYACPAMCAGCTICSANKAANDIINSAYYYY